jgi:hypothetical protein
MPDDAVERVRAATPLNGAAILALREIYRHPVRTGLGSYIGR